MVRLVALVALVAGARAAPAGLDYDFSGRGDGTAVLDLFLRVLKLDAYDELPFASVTIDAGLDCGAAGDAHASLEVAAELIASCVFAAREKELVVPAVAPEQVGSDAPFIIEHVTPAGQHPLRQTGEWG